MNTLQKRVKKLRDGRGWYPGEHTTRLSNDIVCCCYNSKMVDVVVTVDAGNPTRALELACDICKTMNSATSKKETKRTT